MHTFFIVLVNDFFICNSTLFSNFDFLCTVRNNIIFSCSKLPTSTEQSELAKKKKKKKNADVEHPFSSWNSDFIEFLMIHQTGNGKPQEKF